MGEPQMKPEKTKYSYADYLTWDDDVRREIIDGEIWDMSAAPIRKHQGLSMYLSIEIGTFLKDKPCKVYAAPFDVRLENEADSDEKSIYDVVQPDISVICNEKKLDDKGCIGAPDLVVEILSPSTSFKDETYKLNLYERVGVREYWIINPEAEVLMIYLLDNGKYGAPVSYRHTGSWDSEVLSGFSLNISELFEAID